ncbi:MAG TPA: PAS domain-containing protein [Rhizomicrobium sp.]|jgi:hypothetical protein
MTTASERLFQTYNRHAELEGIPHRVDPTLSFEAPPLREALAVWRDCAKGRVIPCRVDMTPKAMKGFLRHLAIVEVVREPKGTRYRLRISGTEIERTLGHLPNGFLEDIVPEPFRSRWQAVLDLALVTKEPIRVFGRMEFRERAWLSAEIFLGALGLYPEAPSAILIVAHFEASPDLIGREFNPATLEKTPAE